MDKKIASLEALLFIHGEPLTYKKISAVLGIKNDELGPIIDAYRAQLEDSGRGLQLIADKEKIQLATKPEFNKILEDFMKEELTEDLTPASLEALAIIAYLGPLSRAKLEYLRGVNSSVILRNLMIRGLVERVPDPEHSSSFLYQPTFDLMKHLGLSKKEDLPEFGKFQELLKVFDAQNQTPVAGASPGEHEKQPPQ
ncbi:MAG TPA: SMC-Scp complex subunit ScpB [Candidatus Paceibacterota bacterium]|nr:SMC-Scp complex subunit ScpB [Candidatus Paceibacterota bacterium]